MIIIINCLTLVIVNKFHKYSIFMVYCVYISFHMTSLAKKYCANRYETEIGTGKEERKSKGGKSI